MVRMVCAALMALLLAACGDSGKDFQLSTEQTYQRLRGLDLGAKIDSATFIFPKHTSTTGEDGKTVTWRFKGKDIMIARLTAKSEDVTNVALELPQMGEGAGGVMASGLAHKLMSERVASHLERRPFNDKEIMDTLYAGSMVPADIQAMALDAQREYASMTRELDEDRPRDDDPYEARRQMRKASEPTTDLSGYERR